MDFMIRFRESVRVVQFAKESRSFVRSFVRSVVFPVNDSVSRSDSLPPPPLVLVRESRMRTSRSDSLPPPSLVLVRESRMRTSRSDSLPPPSLVLVRESRMPAESFRLTSALRPSFSFANASRVGQTHFLPRSQHSNESRNHDSQSWCRRLSINTTLTKLI